MDPVTTGVKTQLNEGVSRLIFIGRDYKADDEELMALLLEANHSAERGVRETAAEIINLIFDTLEITSEPGPFEPEAEAQP